MLFCLVLKHKINVGQRACRATLVKDTVLLRQEARVDWKHELVEVENTLGYVNGEGEEQVKRWVTPAGRKQASFSLTVVLVTGIFFCEKVYNCKYA